LKAFDAAEDAGRRNGKELDRIHKITNGEGRGARCIFGGVQNGREIDSIRVGSLGFGSGCKRRDSSGGQN
jgi:hypothetical protein